MVSATYFLFRRSLSRNLPWPRVSCPGEEGAAIDRPFHAFCGLRLFGEWCSLLCMSPPRKYLSNPRFLIASLVGSLLTGVASVVAPLPVQIAIQGVLVSILVGLVLTWLEEQARRDAARAALSRLSQVVDMLDDKPELARIFQRVGEAFLAIGQQADQVFGATTATKLMSVAAELEQMAAGTIVFRGTEAWRTVYQEILQSRRLKLYRSVAWVKCPAYWQDPPGRQSMRENYDAINRGVIIERIIVLPNSLWPTGQLLPSKTILPWIKDQHNHGVWVMLCRESELAGEPDLPLDFGIYGEQAVGTQFLDEECRTREFLLEFRREAVTLAGERWDRVKLHATPLRTLLDSGTGTT